jgi:peptide chain release factor 1|tara:strand:+ start:92 stop:1168 length:1077 start_codon:yes stop_codon:yes gene_type:complete
MLDKVAKVEGRYEELTRLLQDPAVLEDQARLVAVAREHREIEEVVEAYRALRGVEHELADNKEIIAAGEDPELAELAKEELPELEKKRDELAERIKLLLLPKDPNDNKNVVVEIRAGTGGDEAALFAGDLCRMYSRYSEGRGWRVEVVSMSEGTHGGVKEAILLVSGGSVYSALKFESGVHRVQRVPATESQGRIHTSAATVAILPEAEQNELNIRDEDLRIDTYRSSGAGGQHVNTTDSAIRITHLPSGLVVTCQDEKSQHKNKAKALKVLASRLADLIRREEEAKRAEERRGMVRSGDRSEKIRTYNFPQDRVTDHRIGLTTHNLPGVLQGDMKQIIEALQTHYQTELLKGLESDA